MELWFGHILEKPNEWFLVWAESEEEAILMVDSTYGEPDVRSLLPIDLPGCISLFAEQTEEVKGQLDVFLIPNGDDELVLERIEKPSVEDWVRHCLAYPLGPAKRVDPSYLAQQMRIVQPEVLSAYHFGECPECGSNGFSSKRGCPHCGYRIP